MKSLRRLSLAIVVLGLVFAAAGCDEEENAARVVVDVVSLNENMPLMSDVYNMNNTPEDPTDDYVPVDVVEVTFQARPHDDALTLSPSGPFGSVRFLRYRMEFLDGKHAGGADLDGDGVIDLANFEAPMNTVVYVNSYSVGYIMIVGGGVKMEHPIVDTRFGGELATEARITFFGTEETSGEKMEITRGLTIRIADFGDARN